MKRSRIIWFFRITLSVLLIFSLLVQVPNGADAETVLYKNQDGQTTLTNEKTKTSGNLKDDNQIPKENQNPNDTNGVDISISKLKNSAVIDENVKVVKGASLAMDREGTVYYNGKPLYVGASDFKIPKPIDLLMQKGVGKSYSTAEAIERSLPHSGLDFLKFGLLSLITPNTALAAGPEITYNGPISYGQSTVGDFEVDGEQAFCIEHDKSSAPTGTKYGDLNIYRDPKIQRALYYGWDGPANIFRNDRARGIVVTSLVLSRLYTGEYAGGKSIEGYSKLWDLANNGDMPNYNISFSDTNLSVSVKGDKQVSQTTTLITDKSNSVKISVPSKITLVNETTGKKVTNGSMTVKGGQKIHLEAPLDLTKNYSTGEIPSNLNFQPVLTKASDSRYQTLVKTWTKDPDNTASFTAKFVKRTKKITLNYKDKYSSTVFKTTTYTKPIGYCYDYAPTASFTKSGKTYDRESSSHFEGCLGTEDVTHTFYYKLRRTVTVNYYDNRTGEKIKDSKTYTVHQGDSYSESHPTIKKGEYTYRYVRKTGSSESGKVGTKDITINYYYDLPLAKVKLDKLQIYTAKSSEGLPVKVYMSKVENYPESVKDMSSSKITLALYQGSKKLDSKTFTTKSLPNQTTFKITSGLTKNTHKSYTVKLEGYNKNDFKVVSGSGSLTTDGYTSNEGTVIFDVNSNLDHQSSKSYVVMTEKTPSTSMKKYFETFTYKATPLPRKKTGYGVETTVTLNYTNDLGSDYQYATEVPSNTINFHAPKALMDSYLDYKISGNNIIVPMDKSEFGSVSLGKYTRTGVYHFPHINVEYMTGHLFTDKEVADHDSRIKNDLRDGGHQFYTPIWGDLGDYPVDYTTSPMGANKIVVKMTDSLEVYAQMIASMDSKTIEHDEILMMPVNGDNPFPDGLPEGWTDDDVKWIEK